MMRIILEDVTFNGDLSIVDRIEKPKVQLSLSNHEFEFGKVYHLTSENHWDMWALSLLIGGAIVEQSGVFKIDEHIYSAAQRRKISWLVRYEEVRRFGLFTQTVKNQVIAGIKKGNRYGLSEQDFIQHFKLTPQRYVRYLRQQSAEAWSSSCVIGLAHDKQIFCFPPLEYGMGSLEFVKMHGKKWFFDMLKFMKSLNCLILLPLPIDMETGDFCDAIVKI
ncbi:MAG: hypothetical protein SFZ02_07260 [bacterium]|nr:hypothetical protein [bacterium]